MQSAAKAVPAFTLPEIGQAYGGGYLSNNSTDCANWR